MYEQNRGSSGELNAWLDNVAQAAIHVFSGGADGRAKPQSIALVAPLISKLKSVQGRVLKVAATVLESVNFGAYSGHPNKPSEGVDGDGQAHSPQPPTLPPGSPEAMEEGNEEEGVESEGKKDTGSHWPVSSHKPFLQLVLMCLDGQDEQLAELLESLRTQLTQSLFSPKEDKPGALQLSFPEDARGRQQMLEALRYWTRRAESLRFKVYQVELRDHNL